MIFDVVVAGSGVAGLTAAVTAALGGLNVLLIESTSWFGGTSAFSGGFAWIPCNHHMSSIGAYDSEAEAEAYLRQVMGDQFDEGKVSTYLQRAPEMIRYLENNSELSMEVSTVPDYEVSCAGFKTGRCIGAKIYDGRKLGDALRKLRLPIREMCLFQSMQVTAGDLPYLTKAHRSPQACAYAGKLFGRYLADRVLYGRSTRLAFGNALIARLLRSAMDAGVTLWSNAPAKRLLVSDNRVSGLTVARHQREINIAAKRGIILACGGFGANMQMRTRFVPDAQYGWTLQSAGNQGDGIQMGIAAGGTFVSNNTCNVIWTPVSSCTRSDGSTATIPHVTDRQLPGSILVNAATARRFVNESHHYTHIGKEARAHGVTKMWLIADSEFLRKYGMGMAKPWPFSPRPWIRRGYLKTANSIVDLAKKLDLDPEVLNDTVERFNSYAVSGIDVDFARGDDAHSSYWGDPTHKPNGTLGTISCAPFFAVDVRPGEFATIAGLATNANAQVLGSEGRPIAGLYAVGADNNNMFRGQYPGGGASIGPAMTFAYIAARDLMSRKPTRRCRTRGSPCRN